MNRTFFLIILFVFLTGCTTTTTSPEGFEGFVGEVKGRIIKTYSDVFVLKIHSIERLREDNQAYGPNSARGQTYTVFPKTSPNTAGDSQKFFPSTSEIYPDLRKMKLSVSGSVIPRETSLNYSRTRV